MSDGKEQPDRETQRTASRTTLLVRDLLRSAFLALLCILLGGWISMLWRADGGWEFWILSGLVSFAISIPNLFLLHSPWFHEYPAAVPLLATMWRMGIYFLLVFLRDATNWPADNFFLTSLQGCYFPFLLLESALFINQARK